MYQTAQLGSLKSTLKKVGKAVKKPLIIAAAATATYFTAGAAAPLLAAAVAKKKKGGTLTVDEQLALALDEQNHLQLANPSTPLFIPANDASAGGIPPLALAAGVFGLVLLLARKKS